MTFEFTATMPALEQGIAFFKVKLNIFVFKMHQATSGFVKIYNTGVVIQSRRIGTRGQFLNGFSRLCE